MCIYPACCIYIILLFEYTTYRVPIIPVVVVKVRIPATEAQVPHFGGRFPRSRPRVTMLSHFEHFRTDAVTNLREEHRVSVNL